MKAGELCAGYGGLALAVEEGFGAETAWFSEFEDAPSKILAHHWPGVPNHGDMTAIDWAGIERVDIISGGTPCQDLSAAGRRAGMTEGTRSNLWVNMREAIAIQKPIYVVWENVRGAYSAEASSSLEQCPGCLGDTGDRGTVLRALGRVLGDLSDLGYDCQWRGLRAADVGACHARYRVFVLARRRTPENPDITTRGERRVAAPGQAESGRSRANAGGRSGTPVADADNPGRGEQRRAITIQPEHAPTKYTRTDAAYSESIGRGEGRPESAGIIRGLPATSDSTPTSDANGGDDDGRIGVPQWGQEWREATTWSGEGVGATSDALRGGSGRRAAESESSGSDNAPVGSDPRATNWGDYEPAIRRWEARLGRPAPRPTEPTGRNGGQRLSPKFTEWMMGLPDGWVTDPAIGISRNEQLKACGNGVVPQQAIAALRDMLAAFEAQSLGVAA